MQMGNVKDESFGCELAVAQTSVAEMRSRSLYIVWVEGNARQAQVTAMGSPGVTMSHYMVGIQ